MKKLSTEKFENKVMDCAYPSADQVARTAFLPPPVVTN